MTTREKIIHTAIDLFSKDGYHGVPVRTITSRVGIRESSLYKHFKSKEALLEEIFGMFSESRSKERIRQARTHQDSGRQDLLSLLVEWLNLHFKEMDARPDDKIFRILLNEQFRMLKARSIIMDEMLEKPVQRYSMLFAERLGERYQDYDLLARQYYYPIFTWSYQYSLMVFDKKPAVEIKQKMFEHLDQFFRLMLEGAEKR